MEKKKKTRLSDIETRKEMREERDEERVEQGNQTIYQVVGLV